DNVRPVLSERVFDILKLDGTSVAQLCAADWAAVLLRRERPWWEVGAAMQSLAGPGHFWEFAGRSWTLGPLQQSEKLQRPKIELTCERTAAVRVVDCGSV